MSITVKTIQHCDLTLIMDIVLLSITVVDAGPSFGITVTIGIDLIIKDSLRCATHTCVILDNLRGILFFFGGGGGSIVKPHG